MAHVAESTHWYDRAGNPAYTVKAKDGTERPTTLRDARKLDLLPSVTTVIRCADKPALTNWMVDQGILAALTLPRNVGESESDWLKRVKQDSKEQARKAAARGTLIHGAIQGHYEGTPPDTEYWPHVQAATHEVAGWSPDSEEWVAERSFACRMGYGGKVDLSAFDMDSGFVLDFKTKEFAPGDDLKTWDEHAMQLAAYREGLGYPDARCAIVYVSVTHPGIASLIEIEEAELKKGWKCFYSLLQFWKAARGYDASFERELAA